MLRFERLTTPDLRSDLETPLSPQVSNAQSSAADDENAFRIPIQLSVGVVLLLFGIFVCVTGHFALCDEVVECQNMNRMVSTRYHVFGVFTMAPLLLAEMINFFISYNEAHEPHVAMLSMPSRWQASLMMCVAFSVLLITEASFSTGHEVAHTVVQTGLMETGRPVYTMRYMEWLVSVPILLTISGHFCLCRPMSELVGPIFLTDVYIFLSWEAFVVDNAYLSWLLVVLSFATYAWASYEMLRWASSFLHLPQGSLPARRLRASMIIGMVISFGVYGLIYLLAICSIIDASVEEACYTICDVGVKTIFCIVLTTIRAMDSHFVLAVSFRHISNQNDMVMSLLRGSFDIVMKCTLDSHGNCWLPSSDSTDMRKLEHWLNRSAAGSALNQLLDGPEQQKRFHSYLLGAVRSAEVSSVPEQGVAKVIHCELSSTFGHGFDSNRTRTVALHLSGVSNMSMLDMGRTAFIAMCISPDDEEVPDGSLSLGMDGCLPRQDSLGRGMSTRSLSLSESSCQSRHVPRQLSLPSVWENDSELGDPVSPRHLLPQVSPGPLSRRYSEPATAARKDLKDLSMQTDEKEVVSASAQTEPSASNPSSGSRPPICPVVSSPLRGSALPNGIAKHGGADKPTELVQDGADSAQNSPSMGGVAKKTPSNADANDTAQKSPSKSGAESSYEDRVAKYQARKSKKQSKAKFGSYGARVRHEMDVQAGRVSASDFSSNNSRRSMFSSSHSVVSEGAALANTAEPAHAVSHRSPRSSEWLIEEDSQQPARSWTSPGPTEPLKNPPKNSEPPEIPEIPELPELLSFLRQVTEERASQFSDPPDPLSPALPEPLSPTSVTSTVAQSDGPAASFSVAQESLSRPEPLSPGLPELPALPFLPELPARTS